MQRIVPTQLRDTSAQSNALPNASTQRIISTRLCKSYYIIFEMKIFFHKFRAKVRASDYSSVAVFFSSHIFSQISLHGDETAYRVRRSRVNAPLIDRPDRATMHHLAASTPTFMTPDLAFAESELGRTRKMKAGFLKILLQLK